MIKYISSVLICVSLVLPAISQTIDRTKAPKPQPAPVIKINDPQTFVLPNGIQVLVVENHKAPKVTVSYTIDRTPVLEGSKAGIISLLGSMMNEGTVSKPKAVFDEEVDLIGATVGVGSSGGTASALTKYLDKAVALMSDALRHPSFPSESLEKLRQLSIQSLKTGEKSATAISSRVTNALNFGVSHPYGEFETEESIKGITIADIKDAYAKYVTNDRGYLVFVGDINASQAKAIATKYFGDWKANKLELILPPAPPKQSAVEVDVVDVPNAVQTVIKVTQPIDLRLNNPDYFAMLLTNEILGGGPDARLFKNLREKHGFTYGAGSSATNDRFGAGVFTASASVRTAVTDSAAREFMNELKSIRTEKVTPDELQNIKNYLSGRFALGFETPATIARFALNIAIEKLPKDFYRTYLQKVNAITADDILKAAQKYIPANPRIVMTGKAGDFASKLAGLGYTVKYFDNYAKPVSAAATPQKADASVTGASVIKKYIAAIGGEAALKSINSVNIDFEASIQGAALSGNLKRLNPNKELTTLSYNGATMMKSSFDGTAGYVEMQGQKKNMEPAAINTKTEMGGVFRQLTYDRAGYKVSVDGIEKVNGEDAYKLTIISPSASKVIEYYNIKSGLITKVEVFEVTSAGPTSAVQEIKEYKKFGNVLMPAAWSSQIGPQSLEITVKDVKINEGVSEADFK